MGGSVTLILQALAALLAPYAMALLLAGVALFVIAGKCQDEARATEQCQEGK